MPEISVDHEGYVYERRYGTWRRKESLWGGRERRRGRHGWSPVGRSATGAPLYRLDNEHDRSQTNGPVEAILEALVSAIMHVILVLPMMILWVLLKLCFKRPVVGIPLVLALAAVAYYVVLPQLPVAVPRIPWLPLPTPAAPVR